MIPEWQEAGYRIKLIYLSLPNVEMALDRVAIRVAQGGHNVPEEVIKRRFDSGLNNLKKIYRPLVDIWSLYDNSQEIPILIEQGGK